jgi:hypothetical protein
MPAFYKIDRPRKLVLSTGYGVLMPDELEKHMQRLAQDPDFDPNFSQLADFTHVTQLEVTEADVRRFAQQDIFSPDSRRAFIVRDDATFELAKTFAMVREVAGERGIRVFRTLDEGLDWIVPRIATT